MFHPIFNWINYLNLDLQLYYLYLVYNCLLLIQSFTKYLKLIIGICISQRFYYFIYNWLDLIVSIAISKICLNHLEYYLIICILICIILHPLSFSKLENIVRYSIMHKYY